MIIMQLTQLLKPPSLQQPLHNNIVAILFKLLHNNVILLNAMRKK